MAMMISKFHKIIQSKVVWTAFAILISIAFVGVYTGSKSTGQQVRSQKESELAGRLYGEDISRMEFGQAYQSVYVTYSMMMGRQINITEDIAKMIHKAAWQRLVTLKKADQMGLTVTSDQVVEMIKRQPLFRNQQTGKFDRNAYNAFLSGFLPRVQMSAKGFEVMMAENSLIEKASDVAAQGALVTEDEIKERFHLYNDKTTVQYALLPRSLAGTPTITEEDAKTYFGQNPEQFRMPEKVLVDYVQFAVSDYTNTVTVADEMVSAFYENNKQRYLKPVAEDAPEDVAPEYKSLEEVKTSIVELITVELARRTAYDAADTLVSQLADESATFTQSANESGLKIVDNTPAFAKTDSVKGIDPTAPFARAAFALQQDETHYYSDPIMGRDFVYVASLRKQLPSFLPAFDLVEADVMESAKLAAIEKAYIEVTEKIYTETEAALKAGSSFADAAATHQLELKTTVSFDATTQLEGEFGREIMGSTIMFDTGTLVDLIPAADQFLLAYVAGKELADEAVTLPSMRKGIATGIRNEKAAQLASAWQASLLDEAQFEDLTVAADNSES